MPLSTNDVKHIAKLARLYLTEAEIDEYKDQLSSILEYVQKLQEVNTGDVPELQHSLDVINVFREDVIEECAEDARKRAIENFSSRNGDLLETQSVWM
ncbi:Asp-tRNA(Asn)/Glu-tRNA(Gln) amidotransferase subunit GatC [Candidatus Uhrbacteria bacterium]|nr:Asp-tRNA(Asn)/Glu-tRNA(Gln) amidotransferase subunit GatC [Candidatus Uhrbacteria bacterium]